MSHLRARQHVPCVRVVESDAPGGVSHHEHREGLRTWRCWQLTLLVNRIVLTGAPTLTRSISLKFVASTRTTSPLLNPTASSFRPPGLAKTCAHSTFSHAVVFSAVPAAFASASSGAEAVCVIVCASLSSSSPSSLRARRCRTVQGSVFRNRAVSGVGTATTILYVKKTSRGAAESTSSYFLEMKMTTSEGILRP